VHVRPLSCAFVAAFALLALACSGCGASSGRHADACQLLTNGQAKLILRKTALEERGNRATLCEYYGGRSVLIIQIMLTGSTSRPIPFLSQPGSKRVTVNGVGASWRSASSPRRLNILAFRRQAAIIEVSLTPQVPSAKTKAEQVTADVLHRLRVLARATG
jgi:hypothetical protein